MMLHHCYIYHFFQNEDKPHCFFLVVKWLCAFFFFNVENTKKSEEECKNPHFPFPPFRDSQPHILMNILPNKPPRIYLCVELLTLLRKCEHFLTVNSFSTLTLRFSYCWGWGCLGKCGVGCGWRHTITKEARKLLERGNTGACSGFVS